MKWINVEDGFPKIGENVLVFCVPLGMLCAKLVRVVTEDYQVWRYAAFNKNIHSSNKITHWMKLPSKPNYLPKDISQQGEQC